MNTFHKILFVLAILIANCISASAIEFTVNGVCYSVNDDNTTVTVAGYPSDSKPTGDLTIPESVTYGGISYPVTEIGSSAFDYCSGLTSVTIGNSVTEICNQAFRYCRGLTSVTIPNSVTSIGDLAFYCCSGLTSVTIGNSVISIGGEAFSFCIRLTSVTIPNSVTAIGNRAFEYCSGLTSVTIGNSVTSIGDEAFYCTAWYNNQPDGLVYAGLVAYKYKGTMPGCTSIVLKEGTKGIAGNAFYDCSGLTSVTIPNSVISIGNDAFYKCIGLMSVTIPNSVTSIGEFAFSGCCCLTSVTIPNSVTSIGEYAFRYCYGLTRIDAYPNPAKVSMGSNVFYNVPREGTLHVLPKYLSAYLTASQWRDFTHIKDDLTEIGDINLDGKMNVTDVTTLVNMIHNGETANLELADINADGKVNVSDVTALVNIILN